MNNEDKILAMLEIVVSEQQRTNQRLDALETKVDSLASGQQETNRRLDRIESVHLNRIYHGQARIREDIADLNQYSDASFDEIKRLDRRVDKIQS